MLKRPPLSVTAARLTICSCAGAPGVLTFNAPTSPLGLPTTPTPIGSPLAVEPTFVDPDTLTRAPAMGRPLSDATTTPEIEAVPTGIVREMGPCGGVSRVTWVA